MELQSIIIIALIGIVSGFMGGLLGLGGAVVVVPALVMFMGFSQQLAQGTALIMMVLPVGALAAFEYYQKGFVDIKVSLVLALFFVIGGFFGAKIGTEISSEILKKIFAIMLVGIAIKIWFQK